MSFLKYSNIIMMGFFVWLLIAPKGGTQQNGELFLAYVVTLLFCLIASTDLIMIKPVAFFFTVGGVFALCCILARMSIKVIIKK